jgi:hypothetical protein
MKKAKEVAAICLLTLVTLAVALFLLRRYFPEYFPKKAGTAIDLRMVKAAETLPPFFTGIFRDEITSALILNDPLLGIRARPFYGRFNLGQAGPHDAFGFRNLSIPAFADIVVFGDSQTYGNNAPLELNWPSALAGLLDHEFVVYNTATGGWGPAQYLAMARFALAFRPQLFIVAFYSGNDPLDAFRYVYNFDEFRDLRLFPEMSAKDLAAVVVRPGSAPVWRAILGHGEKLILQPHYRYLANDRNSKVAMAGWKILAECARRIGVMAAENRIQAVFTVIPTKELCFYEYLLAKQVALDPTYRKLIADERQNIAALRDFISVNRCGTYVDLVPALQELARSQKNIFPAHADGHPLANGYSGIAAALFPAVRSLLTERPADGLYWLRGADRQANYFLLRNGEVWTIKDGPAAKKLGLDVSKAAVIDRFRLDRLRWRGTKE